MTPYCLPFDRMFIVCSCSTVFDKSSAQAAQKHIEKNCKGASSTDKITNTIPRIDIEGNDYEQLLKYPEYIRHKGHLCLRLRKGAPTVACVCGKTAAYYKMKGHTDKCEYLKKFNPQGTTCVVPAKQNNCIPIVNVYSAYDGAETNTNITVFNEDKCDDYNIHNLFEDGSCKFYLPKTKKTKKKSDMHYITDKMLQLECVITQNWKKITELIDSKENNEAYMIQAERYQIQLSFDTTKKMLFWEKFCTLFKYNHQHMMDILSYVKKQT